MGGEAYVVNIGQSIRQTLGVETEEQLKEKLSQIKDPVRPLMLSFIKTSQKTGLVSLMVS